MRGVKHLASTIALPWCHGWEGRHEAGSDVRSLHSQEWHPTALHFLSQTPNLDLPWLRFWGRCFQFSVMVRPPDTSHCKCETLYSKFKLQDNHCHWAPHHPWSAGETSSAYGQEHLDVEMETIYVAMLIKWPGKKFASGWTTCINPPRLQVLLGRPIFLPSKF